jgi:hypothetical protein
MSQDIAKATPSDDPLIIRSWPKIVLLLPSFFTALVCGIVVSLLGEPAEPKQFAGVNICALLFLFVLAINLIMVLYDLSLRGFIIVVLLIVALLLGIGLISNKWENVWTTLGEAFSVRVYANPAFYFTFALILLFNLAVAWVITRFNYCKVERNEIIIHRGFMQEQERHPTSQARFKLAIDDVVEWAVLGCGTITFYLGDDDSQHAMPTVILARKKAKRLDHLLGRVAVTTAE